MPCLPPPHPRRHYIDRCITPVDKGGDIMDPANFRPISTLSVFTQIFEKLTWSSLKSRTTMLSLLVEVSQSKFPRLIEKIGKWPDNSFTISSLTDRQVTLLVEILSIREVVLVVMLVSFGIMG